MRQRLFPFWQTDEPSITYSDLQDFCRREYELRSAPLVNRAKQCLQVYAYASNHKLRLRALYVLNECSLELSCLSSAWVEFSNAVFAVALAPFQPDIAWTAAKLQELFDSTYKGLQCQTQTTPQ